MKPLTRRQFLGTVGAASTFTILSGKNSSGKSSDASDG